MRKLLKSTDHMNYTPLHYAAKSGNDVTTKLILDNLLDAKDVNATGHRLKTPLHKAKTAKIVNLLIDQGGKSIIYSKMMKKGVVNNCKETGCKCLTMESVDSDNRNEPSNCCNSPLAAPLQSVFSTLLRRNPKIAEVLLDRHITKNGEELDSKDLLVKYNLKIFQNEATSENKGSPEKDKEGQEEFEMTDEMALHNKIRSISPDLLMHPLSTMFLSLKWSSVKWRVYTSLMLQMLFVISLTSVSIFDTWAVAKNITTRVACLNDSLSNEQLSNDQCYLPKIISLISPTSKHAFLCIYVVLFACTTHFIIRELIQMLYNWSHWKRSYEDIIDLCLVVITALYVVGVYAFPVSTLKGFAAWSTFGGWMKVIFMIGRLPSYGKYVHMLGVVSKMIVGYLLIYSPGILAFSFAFYILLSSSDPFMNPSNALMKTMVMLIGEIDYEDNFMWDKTHGYRFALTTQVLFLLFLLFGCVVLMNLLVGLAVDEIDVLRKEGTQMRHGKFVDEMARLEDLFVSKPRVTDCLPAFCRARVAKNISLLYKLKRSITTNDHDLREFTLCVRPFEFMERPGSEGGIAAAEHQVYFYNETTGCVKFKILTGFKIPGNVVKLTLDWLKKREEEAKSKSDSTLGFDADDLIEIKNNIQKIMLAKKNEKAKYDKDTTLRVDANDMIEIKNNIKMIMKSLKINNDDDEC